MSEPAGIPSVTFRELLWEQPAGVRVRLIDVTWDQKEWHVPLDDVQAPCVRSGKDETFQHVGKPSPYPGGPGRDLSVAYLCTHCSESLHAFIVRVVETVMVTGEKKEQFPAPHQSL